MNNKRRGKYFEDKVALIIREVFGNKKHEVHRFYESGMAQGEFGDIKTPYPWVIECKYYKTVSFETLFYNTTKQYREWLDHLKIDSEKYYQAYGVKPLETLVISKPNWKIIALVPEESYIENHWISEFTLPSKWMYIEDLESFVFDFKDLCSILSQRR